MRVYMIVSSEYLGSPNMDGEGALPEKEVKNRKKRAMERKDVPRDRARRCFISRVRTKMAVEDLLFLIRENGYEIIRYGTASNTPAVQKLVRSLGVEDVCREKKAFSVRRGDARLVFVSDDLCDDDLRVTLAHELGHLACGHMDEVSAASATLVEQEYEAHEFARHENTEQYG